MVNVGCSEGWPLPTTVRPGGWRGWSSMCFVESWSLAKSVKKQSFLESSWRRPRRRRVIFTEQSDDGVSYLPETNKLCISTYSNEWTNCLRAAPVHPPRHAVVESANILNLCACAVFKRTEIQSELGFVCPEQHQKNTRTMLTFCFGAGQVPIHAPST